MRAAALVMARTETNENTSLPEATPSEDSSVESDDDNEYVDDENDKEFVPQPTTTYRLDILQPINAKNKKHIRQPEKLCPKAAACSRVKAMVYKSTEKQ